LIVRKLMSSLGAGMILAMAEPAFADEKAREVEAFMADYLKLWNAGDAKTITEKYYRFDRPNPWQQQVGLQAEFDRLKGQGYSHSDTTGLDSCLISRTEAMTELRYSRMKTDGAAMPPKDRATLYFARKFPDGWRITNFIPMSPTANLNCKSSTE